MALAWLGGPDVVACTAQDEAAPAVACTAQDEAAPAAPQRTGLVIHEARTPAQARLCMEMMKDETPSWVEHIRRHRQFASLSLHGRSRSSASARPPPQMPPQVLQESLPQAMPHPVLE